jgi:hypothetical protein
MEAIIISKEQFQEIHSRLEEISNKLSSAEPNPEKFVDNTDFIELMKVSKRTAQSWRDEGKIAFSQIGGKIYYRYSDIEELLKQHYNKAFNPDFKSNFNRKS